MYTYCSCSAPCFALPCLVFSSYCVTSDLLKMFRLHRFTGSNTRIRVKASIRCYTSLSSTTRTNGIQRK
ncbi:hypothetical protein CYLTODRAFT_79549 [Cylindrobasidium torrendii FP15055 ss-10]|uniref:Uncharacterized protein n=1 Tax=Cylindrobasidium torrendii FP15055 ss-10 TaxID=1314674 RepID=A0A0D7BQV0_9AGAR|nr:hypothetical protein CYLTODRAFT_79549 [Cylindrobasidium torrendii FP15055 ss-10]